MLTSVSFVAAMTMKVASRSLGAVLAALPLDRALGRELLQLGIASGAIRTTRPSQASRPSTFSRPMSPPPTTTQRRPGQLAGRRCRTACRACPARRSGRRSRGGTGRRIPSRRRPELAWSFQRRRAVRTRDDARPATSPTTRCSGACSGRPVVAFAGPRALLMQAAHPVAFAGFFAATTALDDPYPRLERTAHGPARDRLRHARRRPTPRPRRCARVHAPRPRRADASPSGASRPARRGAPTTPSCCCGSSPRWWTPTCSSTSATSAR